MSHVRTLGKELCRWNNTPENKGKPYPKVIRQLISDAASEDQKATALLTGISERKIGEIVLDPPTYIDTMLTGEGKWEIEKPKVTYSSKRIDPYKLKDVYIKKPIIEVSLPKGVKVKVYKADDGLSSLIQDLMAMAGSQ